MSSATDQAHEALLSAELPTLPSRRLAHPKRFLIADGSHRDLAEAEAAVEGLGGFVAVGDDESESIVPSIDEGVHTLFEQRTRHPSSLGFRSGHRERDEGRAVRFPPGDEARREAYTKTGLVGESEKS